MKNKKQEIQKVIEELKKMDVDFTEKMKDKSFEKGVKWRIEIELTPIEDLKAEMGESNEMLSTGIIGELPVIDTGDDEEMFFEGSKLVKKYFRELRKNNSEDK